LLDTLEDDNERKKKKRNYYSWNETEQQIVRDYFQSYIHDTSRKGTLGSLLCK